jgi:hypothetical protein
MRSVILAAATRGRLDELEAYLRDEHKLSKQAASKRMDRIGRFLVSLGGGAADYALCRFRRWREAGWRCAPFEGWVFAYEVVPEGVIVRDMAHGKLLGETDY